ncbi:MAG TPA: hypothetical protein H9894_04350 [Candidatus Desulfovibrio intestinipullorum]|uniref:CRISPR-associated protein Csx11 n=1 Tax=Candidatus Desulfovibrio intestinipullorum TaxID=2838536 RepID=A0A9D1PVK4_9BACT|nr:hypothetical protein [Candidatus Desulfovibrio intestinipullorum]
MEELAALQARLKEPMGDWLQAVPDTPLAALGSLLRAHHSGIDFKTETPGLAHLIPLIMYADTADSLYSKGAGTTDFNLQALDIFLTSPFGTLQQALDKNLVERDARALYRELAAALEGWRTWSGRNLVEKRSQIRGILRKHTSCHLAETRLPNNDVSLWQHSSSVAGIFKALLAGYLLSGNWATVLRDPSILKEELAHCNQRLSFLAFRWETETYMARALRSFEVAGRQEKLQQLTEALKTLVETDCCLGNEIYRDRHGICFLVPNMDELAGLSGEGLFATLLAHIHEQMNELCNGGIIGGELPWSIHSQACGLQIGHFLSFWNAPGKALFRGPKKPAWQEEWQTSGDRRPQICPRCGVHPLYKDEGRIGSGDDAACETCKALSTRGHKILKDWSAVIPSGKQKQFLAFLDEDEDGESSSRVVLIQGIFSLHALCGTRDDEGEPGWEHMVSPAADKKLPALSEVLNKWHELHNAHLSEKAASSLRTYFANLLGMPKTFCTNKEGWCSDEAVQGDLKTRLTDTIRRLVFNNEPLPDNEEELAARMILWGCRQHPAPSRLARVWEELQSFTGWASGLGATDMPEADWLHIPLTLDVTSFQILVPADDAWTILHDITRAYETRFGKVRHILPLHLSASVFRRKAPLYIAMDAARRFRSLAETCTARPWELVRSETAGATTRLTWKTHDGLAVDWDVPRLLPNIDTNGEQREDLFRTWYFGEGDRLPTHLSRLVLGKRYLVWPSTFDYEVLDASVRRYDIRYQQGHRAHYMMRGQGPRPYPLEHIRAWDRYLNAQTGLFKKNDDGKRQRKNAVELLAHLHLDWDLDRMRAEDDTPERMMQGILRVTMPRYSEELLPRALDGSFFDLCEWADFITK